ncbi:SDR family NAD(P)-dependent oxidoreductase [Microbacterium sp. RG1]|uniref:SDR family NAD(P)-dependent oxidoreductase n=1 Tax=Microbacterium sp. RG1 TaxID=2489212 RepID=UPI0010CA35EF|nr:SDR family NAD(P)-dependent oxidoreductase [Microbacterium sp. RG1]QCQ16611.1 SDR family NAD(P)-dependent oxidoreductase [Microbacterium sp. RG1]
MPTIAIVGAGHGLGLSVARRFGHEGFSVALIARNARSLNTLVDELSGQGIRAAAFPADLLDREALAGALGDAAAHFAGIDVLQFSPADVTSPALSAAAILDTAPENTQAQIEFYLYGAMTAARSVLPEMRARATGAIVFVTGGGSVEPVPYFGNISAATGALRNYALNLADAVAPDGVHVTHLALKLAISDHTIPGRVTMSADQIAETIWRIHATPVSHEVLLRG